MYCKLAATSRKLREGFEKGLTLVISEKSHGNTPFFSFLAREYEALKRYVSKKKINADEFNLIYFKRIVKVEYFIEKFKYGKIQEFRKNKKYSSL